MQPAETINALIQRYTGEAARFSFTLSSPVPPLGVSLQCVQLGSAQRLIDEAIRQAFNAGAVYGMSNTSQQVTVIAGQQPRLAPVNGPYPPSLRRRLTGRD